VKAVKYIDEALINPQDLERFVKKGVIALDKKHDLTKFNCIIYPKSTSKILTEFAKFASEKSGVAKLIPDALVKVPNEDITLDFAAIGRLKDPKTRKEILRNFNRAVKDPNGNWKRKPFKMTDVYVKFRKFITNFLKFGDSVIENNRMKRDVYNAITASNVLLIDDFRTTGSTIKEMIKNIAEIGPKHIVICCLIVIEKYKEKDVERDRDRMERNMLDNAGIPYNVIKKDGKDVRVVDKSKLDRKYMEYVYSHEAGDWIKNPGFVGEFEHQERIEDKFGNVIPNPFYDPNYKPLKESKKFFR
jgi:chaperonin GroEL (HSP60 family)